MKRGAKNIAAAFVYSFNAQRRFHFDKFDYYMRAAGNIKWMVEEQYDKWQTEN